MPFLRLELHNHTTESDASITCGELLDYMAENHVDAFALTDHNTISGHRKMAALLAQKKYPLECIYGMEYTTYYGHILCLNLTEYVPWDSIDPRRPELLFEAVRRTGALAGIAHPFSYGYPFATGCRFEMAVTDYSAVDFLEIFNDLEPLHEVNEPALSLWEDLVLSGQRIAATCGMDLHGKWSFDGQFSTFIRPEGPAPIARALDAAVRGCQTWVSKGALLVCESIPEEKGIRLSIEDGGKEGCDVRAGKSYVLSLRLPGGTFTHPMTFGKPLFLPYERLAPFTAGYRSCPAIPKLYEDDTRLENLLCVSPVLEGLRL